MTGIPVVAGELVGLDFLNGVVRPIYDTTLGAPAGSVDFPVIDGAYAHLLVVAYLRGDAAAIGNAVWLRFNGDGSPIYGWQNLTGTGATAASANLGSQSAIVLPNVPGASSTANRFGPLVVFIPHYAGSSNHKHTIAIGANDVSQVTLASGTWPSSAAITELTLNAAGSNFVAGSRVTVYGMGA